MATVQLLESRSAASYDFPMLAEMYLKGELELDRMVTRKIKLEEVEDAFHEMETGDVIRSVIMF